MGTDSLAAAIAARQSGRVSHAQLRECGLTDNAISRRVKNGSLERLLPRVYRLGPPIPTRFGDEWSAQLWAGDDSAIVAGSAGKVWGVVSSMPAVHVAVPADNRKSRPGIQVHRPLEMPPTTRHHSGLTVTTPIETLVAMAATFEELRYEQALAEAQIKELVSDTDLAAAARRNAPGMPMLRQILDDTAGYTHNRAERDLRKLIHDAGLPPGIHNTIVAGHRADVFWPRHRLVLEFDGYGPHRTRKKFEADATASADYAAAGLRLIRPTWRQLRRTPIELAAKLAMALAHDSPQAA